MNDASPPPMDTARATRDAGPLSPAEVAPPDVAKPDGRADGDGNGGGADASPGIDGRTSATDGAADDGAAGPGSDAGGPRPLGCVLPLGDSITQMEKGHFGYRYWLWLKLKSKFPPLRYVGSETDPYGGAQTYPDAAFDHHHEGHWGWRADELLAKLPGWLTGYTPGIVLLHAGTNDAFQGNSVESTISELGQIIDKLRAKNPRVVVLMAQLIPAVDASRNAALKALNAKVPELATKKTTAASPVIVVDQNSGFDPAKETYDGVHPNEAGEKKMADRWAAALDPWLAAGVEPCPR